MTMFRRLTLSAILLVAAAVPLRAQTAINSTTLSAAITSTSQSRISLTSTSTVAVNDFIFVDHEAMKVIALTPLTVTRGVNSIAATHNTLSKVYTGTQDRLYADVPRGSCSRTAEKFLPHIVLPQGDLYDCPLSANVWVLLNAPPALVVTCRMLLIADMVDQSCFTADRPYVITNITEVHKVAEAGGTLTMIPKKQTGTQAAASGAALATAIDAVTTGNAAQTVKTATLTTTATALALAAGDRIGIDFTDDTAGELADVLFTFTLSPR